MKNYSPEQHQAVLLPWLRYFSKAILIQGSQENFRLCMELVLWDPAVMHEVTTERKWQAVQSTSDWAFTVTTDDGLTSHNTEACQRTGLLSSTFISLYSEDWDCRRQMLHHLLLACKGCRSSSWFSSFCLRACSEVYLLPNKFVYCSSSHTFKRLWILFYLLYFYPTFFSKELKVAYMVFTLLI